MSTTGQAADPAGQPEVPDSAGPRMCRAVKHGGVTLHCTEPEGHGAPPDGTWHSAVYTRHEEHVYDGARHVIDHVERVTWEPVDNIAEATRHLMLERRPSDG